MSKDRRRALLEWAVDQNVTIVEDDYDSEYQYGADVSSALYAESSAACIIYVGTFSKNFMPGVRLGYIVASQELIQLFTNAKWLTDRHSDNLSQAVMAEFMQCGRFNRHLSRMRTLYAERHSCLQEFTRELAQREVRLLPSNAGLHMTALLQGGQDEADVIARAAESGIGVCGLKNTYFGDGAKPGLILGFGNNELDALQAGMRIMLDILQQPQRRGG